MYSFHQFSSDCSWRCSRRDIRSIMASPYLLLNKLLLVSAQVWIKEYILNPLWSNLLPSSHVTSSGYTHSVTGQPEASL